jgi:hypothetical protein
MQKIERKNITVRIEFNIVDILLDVKILPEREDLV